MVLLTLICLLCATIWVERVLKCDRLCLQGVWRQADDGFERLQVARWPNRNPPWSYRWGCRREMRSQIAVFTSFAYLVDGGWKDRRCGRVSWKARFALWLHETPEHRLHHSTPCAHLQLHCHLHLQPHLHLHLHLQLR